MSKFWRIVLAWMLAVALPVQGYAAQTMLFCGPASPSIHQASAPAPTAAEPAAVVSADADCHPQDGMNAAAHHCDKASQKHGKHSGPCSVCASCCSAVAIMTGIVTMAVVHPDLLDVPTIRPIRDRVMVSGLERPPRSLRL